MGKPLIATPETTKYIINRYGLSAKKSFGQNFLTDPNILAHMVSAAKLTGKDNVIEIGPGIGALTEFLAKNSHQVLAFEIDKNLIPILDETLSQYTNVKIINQNFLQINLLQELSTEFDMKRPLKIVANLPYYITTPMLMKVLQSDVIFNNITVMVQREVANRLVAVPDTKSYGSLSIAVQYLSTPHVLFSVPRTVFIPQPNVESSVVTMTKEPILGTKPFNDDVFLKFVKKCFLHRRKSFWNNLLAIFGKNPNIKDCLTNVLEKNRISSLIRAENLTINQFIEITNSLHSESLL